MIQLHRRLLKEDAFSVHKALNEIPKDMGLMVHGRHCIDFNNIYTPSIKVKEIPLGLALFPLIFIFTTSKRNMDNWHNNADVMPTEVCLCLFFLFFFFAKDLITLIFIYL